MPKSAEQAIFDDIFAISLNKDYATFDYKPARDQSYPFVYVGQTINTGQLTKAYMYGNVLQSLEVWHDHKKRRELTDIMNDLKSALIRPRIADVYKLTLRSYNTQIRIDDSTGEPLLQGIIDVEYRYNRR